MPPRKGHGGGQPNALDRGAGQQDASQLTGVIKHCWGSTELARILQVHKKELSHIHVSTAWVCLARIGKEWGTGDVREVVTELQDRTWDVVDHAGGRELANMVHSVAQLNKIGVRVDQRLRLAMQRRATATAGEFTPQAVSNLLWALATMGVRPDQWLLEAMQRQATATAEEFNPQNVTNVLWALATMGQGADGELLEAMQRRATATAREFNPQETANVLWALAKMGHRADRGLLEAMQGRATATARESTSQGAVNML